MLAWLLGCRPDPAEPPPRPDPAADPPAWDAEAAPIRCAADDPAPLLDRALADADLGSRDEVAYDEDALDRMHATASLDDRFLLPWYREVHDDPLGVPCHARQVAADLDAAAASPHPVATALGEAIALLGIEPGLAPIDPATATQDAADLSALPADLAEALVPVLQAIAAVDEARAIAREEAPASNADLVRYGHGGGLIDFVIEPDLADDAVQRWVKKDTGARATYEPARVLAYAIEQADLERFAGLDAALDVDTDLGRIVVAGPGPDEPGDIGPVALYVDLGGDDVYVHPAGASAAAVAAGVHVDLGGNDTYGYVATGEAEGALLAPDEGGRYGGDAYYGPFSLSGTGRQGSGRFGVGLLFDLGGGDDRYVSLRASQGWGQLGVGVLFDDGGSDTYAGEAGVQGAATMGIGLLLDLGEGDDVHTTFSNSQGFAFVQAVGVAYDGGGTDLWHADPGRVSAGGTPVYYSPQLPGDGNSSFVQGAGFGLRGDSTGTYLSGGIGVLRDLAGDDRYTASVFGQATGYWQGTGYLADGGGADAYDALWYVQAGAAHYALAALLDAGPEADRYGEGLAPVNVHLGSGHDFSVGVLVDEAGDDRYVLAGLAAGASNCQGVGLFADLDGADTYAAASIFAVGLGNHSAECPMRTDAPSTGLFLDSGGDPDAWTWPADPTRPAPSDGATFGWSAAGTPDEHGGAADGEGATALELR